MFNKEILSLENKNFCFLLNAHKYPFIPHAPTLHSILNINSHVLIQFSSPLCYAVQTQCGVWLTISRGAVSDSKPKFTFSIWIFLQSVKQICQETVTCGPRISRVSEYGASRDLTKLVYLGGEPLTLWWLFCLVMNDIQLVPSLIWNFSQLSLLSHSLG